MLGAMVLSCALCGDCAGLSPQVNEVGCIEYNCFGLGENRRWSVIFRAHSGEILAWRWFSRKFDPVQVRPGMWSIRWLDGGRLISVYSRNIRITRTEKDAEVEERARLPDEKRKGLLTQ